MMASMFRGIWTLLCLVSLLLAAGTAILWARSYAAPAALIYYGEHGDYLLTSNHGQFAYAPVKWENPKQPLGLFVDWNSQYRTLEGTHLVPATPPVQSDRFYLTTNSPNPAWTDRWGLQIASGQAPADPMNFQVYTFPHFLALLIFLLQPVLWLRGRSRQPDPVTGERIGFFARVFGLLSFVSLLICIASLALWAVSYRFPISAKVQPAARSWQGVISNGRATLGPLNAAGQVDHTIAFPGWVPAAGAAILPLLWLLGTRGRRSRKARLKKRLCPSCGSELGETPNRCEMCGWTRPATAAKA
jgi:hypothetical protein